MRPPLNQTPGANMAAAGPNQMNPNMQNPNMMAGGNPFNGGGDRK